MIKKTNMRYRTDFLSTDGRLAPQPFRPLRSRWTAIAAGFALVTAFATAHAVQAATLTTSEVRAIAKEATIYGFPLVDNYRVQYTYFVDKGNPEYRSTWNTLNASAQVMTPADKTVQTPNSDTPYAVLGADLRAEPLVLTVPEMDNGRYYSIQFVDMYTFNFAYVGSRATGNEAGRFLLAGPDWKGTPPKGIKSVIRAETNYAFALYRTQLRGPNDIDNVKRIQSEYRVEPLSQYLGKAAPPSLPVDFMKPLTVAEERTSIRFFDVLNFVLQFCPTAPSETALRARLAQIGIGAGKSFDTNTLAPDMKKALADGFADGWAAFNQYKTSMIDTGKAQASGDFGTRAYLKNDYMARMAGAVMGIYGNSKEEAMYPLYLTDGAGTHLNGSNRYVLHFAPGQLPPVHSFWSLTMYALPSSLLYANSLNRYLINSPMLPTLKRDADGGLTLYVQHESPGPKHESNWLPAPAGPFFIAMRLYWPKQAAIDGEWKAPPMQVAQ
ncbi:DUF1254 domain-containing protein [Paraburkholderia sp. J63]|uniref:DUF1254 domain-containing protein n=1 Tax=Paraburkholderia sp. J63 TaxID=2805434 RepID=UPI002ABD57ED|nr:DUF1254 domain-containing protein [Paraburkholderia sp. J63]